MIGRRTFIKSVSMGTAGLSMFAGVCQAQRVPNSSGAQPPGLKAPPNACDCHHHIFDARFPFAGSSRIIPKARLTDYRLLQRRLGTTRSVVVTPAPFPASVADNMVTLDAIAQQGARRVALPLFPPK